MLQISRTGIASSQKTWNNSVTTGHYRRRSRKKSYPKMPSDFSSCDAKKRVDNLRGYQKIGQQFTASVTPECFNRGSTLLTTTLSRLSKGRGSSPKFVWIPLRQAQCGEPSRATAKSMCE